MAFRIFILFFCIAVVTVKCDKNCTHLLKAFEEGHKEYMHCVIVHAEPVTYCTECVQPYRAMVDKYAQLLNGSDTKSTCHARYIDVDKFNVLPTVYAAADGFWKQGACSECFECDPLTSEFDLSNGTISTVFDEIKKLMVNLNVCTNSTNMDAVCGDCLPEFAMLNMAYNKLVRQKGDDHLCFDMRDAVNKTQYRWYDGCGGRPVYPHGDAEYIVLSSVAGGLTTVASAAWYVYKRIIMKMRRDYAFLNGANEDGVEQVRTADENADNAADAASDRNTRNQSLIDLE